MLNAVTMPTSRPDIRMAVGLSVESMRSVPAVQGAEGVEAEKAVRLAAHHGRREAAGHPEAGVLPQEGARQGQLRMDRVAVPARRVGEAVAGCPNRRHRAVVEPA